MSGVHPLALTLLLCGDQAHHTQHPSLHSDLLIVDHRTDPAVDERFKKMDAERDFIQSLSQGTRMRRIGPQAVEVKVPLPVDPDAKPVPGRVPKAKPLIEHEALVNAAQSLLLFLLALSIPLASADISKGSF